LYFVFCDLFGNWYLVIGIYSYIPKFLYPKFLDSY
jgi:hypothetical protein